MKEKLSVERTHILSKKIEAEGKNSNIEDCWKISLNVR